MCRATPGDTDNPNFAAQFRGDLQDILEVPRAEPRWKPGDVAFVVDYNNPKEIRRRGMVMIEVPNEGEESYSATTEFFRVKALFPIIDLDVRWLGKPVTIQQIGECFTLSYHHLQPLPHGI